MPVNTKTGELPQVRPLPDVLRDFGRGNVLDEGALMLAELVQAVRTYGRKGTLTIKIVVAPVKGQANMLQAAAKVTSAPPESDPVAAFFYSDDTGNLLRDDPDTRQLDLGLREVPVARADAELGARA